MTEPAEQKIINVLNCLILIKSKKGINNNKKQEIVKLGRITHVITKIRQVNGNVLYSKFFLSK